MPCLYIKDGKCQQSCVFYDKESKEECKIVKDTKELREIIMKLEKELDFNKIINKNYSALGRII